MVEFNGGLNCEPIRKLCPEVDPACLNCLKNYAKLCLSQISFEIARKKPREKLSSEMLAKLAAQNRIYAREVVGSVKPEFGKGMQSVQVHCSQYAACMDLTVNGLMMEQALNENKYGVAEAWAKRCQIDLQSLKSRFLDERWSCVGEGGGRGGGTFSFSRRRSDIGMNMFPQFLEKVAVLVYRIYDVGVVFSGATILCSMSCQWR